MRCGRGGESRGQTAWYDVLAIDSEYDYDPVWAKCVELKVGPTFHSASRGLGFRQSTSNFTYNHIGHFATAGEAVCKAIFMGGVTRRFPTLKFAFLEGGVGWACQLYADLIGHWKKRNAARARGGRSRAISIANSWQSCSENLPDMNGRIA